MGKFITRWYALVQNVTVISKVADHQGHIKIKFRPPLFPPLPPNETLTQEKNHVRTHARLI